MCILSRDLHSLIGSFHPQAAVLANALREARTTNSPSCYFDTSEKLPAAPISSPNYHTGSSRIFDTNKQSIEIKMVGGILLFCRRGVIRSRERRGEE